MNQPTIETRAGQDNTPSTPSGLDPARSEGTSSQGNGISVNSQPTARSFAAAKRLLVTAAWFGLVTGLIEGIALWSLQQAGWLTGILTFQGFSAEIIWLAVLFDLLLFCAVGLVLGLVAWVFPRLPTIRIAVFLFASMVFLDWLGIVLIGRARIWAIAVLALGFAVESARRFGKHQAAVERFWRKSLPWIGAVAFLALVGIQSTVWLTESVATAKLPEAAAGSPNILVIVVDALRADHVSSYGYARPTTPNIDRLAQEGLLFESAFSTSSWTQPSHASMLTGRYPYEHGADLYNPLDDRYPTIAEALQARGYRTGAFSGNIRVFCRRLGFGRGFHHFEDYYRSIGNMLVNTFYGRTFEFYALHQGLGFQDELGRKWADDVNHSVLSWIDRDAEKPFFVFINYYDVHDPYTPPEPYRSKFAQMENPGGRIDSYWGVDNIYVPMTPDELQGELDAYDGGLVYVDEQIDQLLNELGSRGLAENLLVVVTSDHGESFGEHGLLHPTNSLYREVIHVPLIFWWRGHVPEGGRVAQPVSISALPSTLLDLLGQEEQPLFPGPSLTALWTDPQTGTDGSGHVDWPYPLAELVQHPWLPTQNPSAHGAMRSVLSPEWHYITHEEFGEELYDWPADPQETSNLAKRADMQPVTQQLRTYLGQFDTNTAGLTR
jgi:arylsulfatase A-like enzyme